MITLTNHAPGALEVVSDSLTDFSDIELDYVIYRENLEHYGASLDNQFHVPCQTA